jgi:hypothetical protein
MITLVLVTIVAMQDQNVATLESTVKHRPGPANYRMLADAYRDEHEYQKASFAYEKAANGYRANGDPNAAKVLMEQANRYRSSIRPFVLRPASSDEFVANYSRAKWEPYYGCYLGANIDREDAIENTFMDNDQVYRDPAAFDRAIGKHQAIFFTYLSYGRPFPSGWARVLAKNDAGAQIAWEPRSLAAVEDDRYLERFAEQAYQSGIPIFLRFASEMNGDWTYGSYGGNPPLYREKFRLVAQVMHRIAPNVAMVWCPNETPEEPIPSYFPGDDAVDWVGVNFYSVLFNDGDRARAADWRNPTDALDYIYRTYSAKHPIMVGEWAATHRSVLQDEDNDVFAIEKIQQFYTTLPMRYPRVKAVNWLSMNTMEHAEGERKLNDFSLLAKSDVASAFGSAVSSPYYLDMITEPAACSNVQYVPVSHVNELRSGDELVADVRCYDSEPTVVWKVDGREIGRTSTAGASHVHLNDAPSKSVTAVLVDRNGRTVLSLSTK